MAPNSKLELQTNLLRASSIAELSMGSWPALGWLDLSHSQLDAAGVVASVKGDWPQLHNA